jgi:hypothetical protein
MTNHNQVTDAALIFDVLRKSDRVAGRAGAAVVTPPVAKAVFNAEENRWEASLTLRDLAAIGGKCRLVLCFPPKDSSDLPILEIEDVDDAEDVVLIS